MGVESCVDSRANCLRTIHEEHALIHDGKLFDFTDIQASLAFGASYSYAFQCPAGAYPHLAVRVDCDKLFTVSLTEGATVSGGSAGTAYNRNRPSAITNNMTITKGVTPSGGTVIWTRKTIAGKIGDIINQELEWILKPLTSTTYYVLTITNNDGAASANVSTDVSFYEFS